MQDAYRQLIVTICDEVLPNMVRLSESQKVSGMFDHDYFVKLVEQKVARANKVLKMLPPEDQPVYREKINHAYAVNIDRLREQNTEKRSPRPTDGTCDTRNSHI
ncbi:MAG: hypothetical protein NTZ39_02855 [Methanoregula sp.]|nr:hypothetical protein [Methanoregula sp.]